MGKSVINYYAILMLSMLTLFGCGELKVQELNKSSYFQNDLDPSSFGVRTMSTSSNGTSCEIMVSDCPKYNIPLNKFFLDSDQTAQTSQIRCEQRAKEYHHYCGTRGKAISRYYNGTKLQKETNLDTRCLVKIPNNCTRISQIPSSAYDNGWVMDYFETSEKNQTRCLQRASDYFYWCGSVGDTEAKFQKVGQTVALDRHFVSGGTRCEVTVSDCPLHPSLTVKLPFLDNYENSQTSQSRCMQRAKDYHAYCGTKGSVIVSFYSGNQVLSTTNLNTRCMVKIPQNCTAAAGIPQSFYENGWLKDYFENSNSDQARCLKRAEDYYHWCGQTEPAIARFERTGGVLHSGAVFPADTQPPNPVVIEDSPPHYTSFKVSATDNIGVKDYYCSYGSNAFAPCGSHIKIPTNFQSGNQRFRVYAVDYSGNKSTTKTHYFTYRHAIKKCTGPNGEPLLCEGNQIYYVKGHNFLPFLHTQDLTLQTCLNRPAGTAPSPQYNCHDGLGGENIFWSVYLAHNSYIPSDLFRNQVIWEANFLKNQLGINSVRFLLPRVGHPNMPNDTFKRDANGEILDGTFTDYYLEALKDLVETLGDQGIRTQFGLVTHAEQEIRGSQKNHPIDPRDTNDFLPGGKWETFSLNNVAQLTDAFKDSTNIVWFEPANEAMVKWTSENTFCRPDAHGDTIATFIYRVLQKIKEVDPNRLRSSGEVLMASKNFNNLDSNGNPIAPNCPKDSNGDLVWAHPAPELYGFNDTHNITPLPKLVVADELDLIGTHYYNEGYFHIKQPNINSANIADIRYQPLLTVNQMEANYNNMMNHPTNGLENAVASIRKRLPNTPYIPSEWGIKISWWDNSNEVNTYGQQYQLRFFQDFYNLQKEHQLAGASVWTATPTFKVDTLIYPPQIASNEMPQINFLYNGNERIATTAFLNLYIFEPEHFDPENGIFTRKAAADFYQNQNPVFSGFGN